MTDSNTGTGSIDVAELLAALAAAAHQTDQGGAGNPDYQAGVADGYARAQSLVREIAGWPLEKQPLVDEP